MRYIKPLNENKPKGAPEFHHSDAPDAEGRFKDLGIKDLAAWLIKTRKKDVKKISGSLTQQIVFNRGDDPKYAEKMEKVRKEVYKQLGREDLLEESVNEGKMPKKYIGNDEIVFLKTKEDSRGAHYNLYYKGHDIDFGGRMFGSEKQLKDFADNYILSNQWYKKLRYEDSIPLPESVDMDDLENAKYRLKDQGVYKHLDIEYKQTRRGERYVQIHYIPISRPQSQNPEWVNVRYGNAKDLKKISKELNMDLNESVLNEEDTWNDYPAAAKKNAQMAIDWKEKYGRDEVDAGTPVGWARAHQLAKGENLSTDTVKRMSAFNRHRKNSSIKPELKETPWKDRGYVAWLIWGGDEGVDWAIEKSKEIDAMKESKQMKHIKQLNEAEKYITDEFKVGDKIKTDFGEWEVIETDYAPGKSFMAPFIFKGKDMERVNIPNPPRTNKKAVGYKVTDGDKYPIIGFLYQYKDITKLATVGVDESVVTEKLARGLKPLLTLGSTIDKKVGEDALLDLSDKFDRIDDEYAGTIASWLDMAIELMQDGYAGDATKKLKQFNKACKDVLNGKDIGSAFESVVAEGIYAKKSKIVPGEYIKTQYGYFYKRVEGTVGGEDAYVEIKKGKEGKKKTGIHDTVDFDIVDKSIALSESVTEGMSKSAIKKAIKVIDQQIEDEEGGDGEPLDNETLQALEQERERLLGMNEIKRSMISGTSGRTIDSLEDRKYELKKDVKDARIGNFTNVTLPKGTIIYNLPGGVFADHIALKQRYTSRSSQGPQYFDKSTFKGVMITSMPDTLAAIEKNGKVLESVNEAKEFKYIKPLNEFNQVNESLSSYEYDKWVKENGKIKFPKWIKVKSKEIIDGGFMDKVYKSEHNYMSIWLGSFDNKTRSELYAYDDKGKKEFGEMGYKFIQSFWNDITGYTMFFWQGAVAALEVSKHIRDMEANGEAIEPAYYLMKEYFNNFGMETNRSRVFNAAVEKLEKWMEDNQIKTL